MILRAGLSILLFVSVSFISAQDSLIFCLRKNESRQISIPLAKFNVKLKTSSGKKYNVRIVGFGDSVLHVRVKRSTAKSRKELKVLLTAADTTRYPAYFTDAQYDSVLKSVSARAMEIQYPEMMSIDLKDVRKIKINNNDRPEKKRLMKTMKIAPFILVPSLFVAPLSQSVYVIAPVYGLTGMWAVSALILQTKTINLKKKWKLKKNTKHEARAANE